MSRRHLLMLLALAIVWGASFMFIKVGVEELAPSVVVLFRLVLGALTLAPIVLVRLGRRAATGELRANARPLAVAGVLNSAIPFWTLSWGETRIDSGLAAVIQASAPLFAAVLALRFSRGERVTGARLVGLLVGFGGVALLVGVRPRAEVGGALAVVATALCYAAAALYIGRRLAHVSALVTALGALIAAALAMLPAGLAQLPAHAPSWKATGALLALGIGGTGLAYVLYYALIAGAGASRSILITYLVPAFAVVYGASILGEPVTVAALVGLALVLVGVALGTGATRLARRRHPEPARG